MRWTSLTVIAALGLAPAASAQECPNIDPDLGYPVAAVLDGTATASLQWLDALSSAVAYRWRVPSRRRNAYAGWERVRHRVLPPEPRWADDWRPEPRHVATLRVVLYRDGRDPRGSVVGGSGDGTFDKTLSSIWEHPMPDAPAFPEVPREIAEDSVIVLLYLGDVPDADFVGIERFPTVQTSIELLRNTLRVSMPSGRSNSMPRTTVKYDVTATGAVDTESIEFLTAAPAEFQDAIRTGLMVARFRPPTSNCRPVAQTVVQTFGG